MVPRARSAHDRRLAVVLVAAASTLAGTGAVAAPAMAPTPPHAPAPVPSATSASAESASRSPASPSSVTPPTLAPPASQPPAAAPGAASSVASAPAESPRPTASDPRTASVAAFVAGGLDVAVDPASLFDVDLRDEVALAVERVRVESLLDAMARASAPPPPPPKGRPHVAPPPEPTAVTELRAMLESTERATLDARVELDRARLAFYRLPAEVRQRLLDDHAARVEAARPRETEAARRARAVEEEHARLLEEARNARTEVQRIVTAEVARLAGIEAEAERVGATLRDVAAETETRRALALGWQRRAREATSLPAGQADQLYGELRTTLRAARALTDRAIDDMITGASAVPTLGPDPIAAVSPGADAEEVRVRRERLDARLAELRSEERAVVRARASALLDEIGLLNQERIALIPHLSPGLRDAITGFGPAGLDQARAEGYHLLLTLRFHQREGAELLSGWLSLLRGGGAFRALWSWSALAAASPWVVLLAVFVWWRKRSDAALEVLEHRAAASDRAARRTVPSGALQATRFVRGVHAPLEWLLAFLVAGQLLPERADAILEVQLLTEIVRWSLGGAVVVHALNSFAALPSARSLLRGRDDAVLRLRSLRLIGRAAIALGLLLEISERLVGRGTIHHWVRSAYGLVAVLVAVVLLAWWRARLFARVERQPRRTPTRAWILAHTGGWASPLAAALAAVVLAAGAALRFLRSHLQRVELMRRVLAYLFKRGLERLPDSRPSSTGSRAPDRARLMSPDVRSADWLPCPADDVMEAVRERLAAGRGGLVAVVGPRGMGKTELLARVSGLAGDAASLVCTRATTAGTVRDALSSRGPVRLVTLDDAQRLVLPALGGLARLDEVLALARARATEAVWIFAFDDALWPLLLRARDGSPLFDQVVRLEPWTDEQVSALIDARCGEAGIEPSFDGLLERGGVELDDLEREEALEATRIGYTRMVWDYARGNPGVVLAAFGAALVEDDDRVRVVPLREPGAGTLESLPDPTLFVLRAVLQLEPASIPDVSAATRIAPSEVESVVRFAQSSGCLHWDGAVARIAWPWVRPIQLHLQRRRLLWSAP